MTDRDVVDLRLPTKRPIFHWTLDISMISARLDSALATLVKNRRFASAVPQLIPTYALKTACATVELYDSGSNKPCLILVPDGPNVIAHYARLIALLKDRFRIVCFDMPGFGYSIPGARYDHSLDQGAATVISVMDELKIRTATLAFSCANGLYALRVAQLAPDRVSRLLLSQTPSLAGMQAWSRRVVPRILHRPILGQALAWMTRRKMANSWYAMALPKGSDTEVLRQTASHALRCGGCFSLASVVQGLGRENVNALQQISTPCTVLWGDLDRSHKHTDPASILAVVPHAEIIRFDDCGHFPDIEQPERFAQLLLNAHDAQA